MNQEREQIARIILGPTSSWNFGQARTWNLTEWAQYPETTRALAKADQIIALRSGGEGWRLVPVEPTEAMLDDGLKAASECTADFTARSGCIAEHMWDAMLSAAPSPSTHGEG